VQTVLQKDPPEQEEAKGLPLGSCSEKRFCFVARRLVALLYVDKLPKLPKTLNLRMAALATQSDQNPFAFPGPFLRATLTMQDAILEGLEVLNSC
jgi:hypothetical protein